MVAGSLSPGNLSAGTWAAGGAGTAGLAWDADATGCGAGAGLGIEPVMRGAARFGEATTAGFSVAVGSPAIWPGHAAPKSCSNDCRPGVGRGVGSGATPGFDGDGAGAALAGSPAPADFSA